MIYCEFGGANNCEENNKKKHVINSFRMGALCDFE